MVFLSELSRLFVVVLMISVVVVLSEEWIPPSKEHGSVMMGVSNPICDNGVMNLTVDFNPSDVQEYTCMPNEYILHPPKKTQLLSCLRNQDIPAAIHLCMNTAIKYDDDPPRGGPHRPLWPIYGEYIYCPPQRWVHSLEHGAVVFIYHPCADPRQVDYLKMIVKSCLRRHIITPYRNLPIDEPFAFLTYGCKLMLSHAQKDVVVQFILENAMNPNRASEAKVWKEGQFSTGLREQAKVVPGSDIQDTNLCSGLAYYDDDVYS